jgi:YegS/Rv2252/BmrU family lipid kinase
MNSNWYTIINPTSGKGNSLKQLALIKRLFNKYNIHVTTFITEFIHHEKIVVQEAIKQGFTKFICIGGDGTLHHIVNGIMTQQLIDSNKIKLGVIPVGTGNDWVKTYKISKNIERAIQVIKNEKTIYQDIGSIQFLNNNKKLYFNNVAGIGFDAFVVNKISNIKKLGPIAYLIGGLSGFFSYKKNTLQASIGNKKISSKIFMISIGICQFSGGGMQLTDFKNHKNGHFDITLIKNITLIKVLMHIKKLYNANIIKLKEVESYQCKSITIKIEGKRTTYIQADGELLGIDDVHIKTIKNALQFVVPH